MHYCELVTPGPLHLVPVYHNTAPGLGVQFRLAYMSHTPDTSSMCRFTFPIRQLRIPLSARCS
jgi:hypothetical protein